MGTLGSLFRFTRMAAPMGSPKRPQMPKWNQPVPWKQYPQVPKAMLPGEIIQIGAVKLDPAGNAVDELRLGVRPRF